MVRQVAQFVACAFSGASHNVRCRDFKLARTCVFVRSATGIAMSAASGSASATAPAAEAGAPGAAKPPEDVISLLDGQELGAFRPGESSSLLNKKIADLKAEQARMLAAKKRLSKDLRNAERKRKRIKERARQLTDEDLVAVLMMRKETRSTAAAATAASPKETDTSLADDLDAAEDDGRDGRGDKRPDA